MKQELYRKHRPTLWKQVIGQPDAVNSLQQMLKQDSVPHVLLFSGPSGSGKTTCARILAHKLKCGEDDLHEINAASSRGIDEVRKIENQMRMYPRSGEVMVWIVDEAHKLSNDAQNALLKPTEETPETVYFILASSMKNKLIETLRSRATDIPFAQLSDDDIVQVLLRVADKERKKVDEELGEKIISLCMGNARSALVMLHKALAHDDIASQLDAVSPQASEKTALDLIKSLNNPRVKWGEFGKILAGVNKWEDAETIRRQVLGYYRKSILSLKPEVNSRAYIIIQAFRDHFFDCGQAGLNAACYEVLIESRRK